MSQLRSVILLIICGTLLGYGSAGAQTLDSLLRVAQRDNLQLKYLQQQYLAALEKAPQVSQLPDPEVGVGVFVRAPETRVGPQIARIGASQMLPWKGVLDARKDLALASAEPQIQRVEAMRLQILFNVKKAYLQLYRLDKTQDIVRENLRILSVLDRFALSKVESGKGSAADVLRVQLKTEELQQELMLLNNQKANFRAALNEMLNAPASATISVLDSFDLAQAPMSRETLSQNIHDKHPVVQMYGLQQEVSRKSLALNQLSAKPSFGVGIDYILVNKRTDMEVPANGKDIIMPRASISIPLNRGKYEAKEREERIVIESLELQKQQAELSFMTVIEQAFTDIEEARLRTDLVQQLRRITETTISLLQTEYSASGRGFDELLRHQMELLSYDQKVLEAVVKSQTAKATIERYFTQ